MLLFRRIPRNGIVTGKLVACRKSAVEVYQVAAVSDCQHGRSSHFRLEHLDVAARSKDEHPTGIGTRKGEVPVRAVVLHHLRVPVVRTVH